MTLGTLGWPLVLLAGGGWFFLLAWQAITTGTTSIGASRLDRAASPLVFWLVLGGLMLTGASCVTIAALFVYLSV